VPVIPGANDGGLPRCERFNSIIDGNWHLVAYTYHGNTNDGNNGSLYVDGALVGHNGVFVTPAGDNLDVWIGGAPDYGTAFGTARLVSWQHRSCGRLHPGSQRRSGARPLTGEVSLTITHSGSNVVITWPSGILSRPALTGPWTTNTPPFRPTPSRRERESVSSGSRSVLGPGHK